MHLFEHTVQLSRHTSQDSYFAPVQMQFALKVRNGGKLNSHLWFMIGFCRQIQPRYVLLLPRVPLYIASASHPNWCADPLQPACPSHSYIMVHRCGVLSCVKHVCVCVFLTLRTVSMWPTVGRRGHCSNAHLGAPYVQGHGGQHTGVWGA